jgi:hypothetical protein
VLQHRVIERIEQLQRLRLLYGAHLALYGIGLVFCALSASATDRWLDAALMVMIWLPVVLLHTALQSLLELRERRAVCAPAPVRAFNYNAMTVQIYDEDGNPVASAEPKISLLPRPFGES